MKGFATALFFPLLLLAGCATEPAVVVDDSETMLYLDPGLRPESLRFPEYLLMGDFEIDQHGGIPSTTLVGADIKTHLDLATTRQRYDKLLASKGWKTLQAESSEHAFRLLASRKGATVEIRAVQGSGPTQVFLLYRPGASQT